MIFARLPLISFAVLSLTTTIACHDSGTGPANRRVATVDVALAHTELEQGQHEIATAVARDQFGAPIDAGPVSWSSTFPIVAVINAATGEIVGNASGNAEIVATVAGQTGRLRITVSPPALLINEVFPNGDLPGGWVEVFNPTAEAVNMEGWTVVTPGPNPAAFTFPAGVIIESGGFAAVNDQTLPNGLHATGAVALFSRFGVLSDAFAWNQNAGGTSYARCPDGMGGTVDGQAQLVVTATPTRKAPNACQ
jgi:hypothetical protein